MFTFHILLTTPLQCHDICLFASIKEEKFNVAIIWNKHESGTILSNLNEHKWPKASYFPLNINWIEMKIFNKYIFFHVVVVAKKKSRNGWNKINKNKWIFKWDLVNLYILVVLVNRVCREVEWRLQRFIDMLMDTQDVGTLSSIYDWLFSFRIFTGLRVSVDWPFHTQLNSELIVWPDIHNVAHSTPFGNWSKEWHFPLFKSISCSHLSKALCWICNTSNDVGNLTLFPMWIYSACHSHDVDIFVKER